MTTNKTNNKQIETLVKTTWVETGITEKTLVVAGDCVAEINNEPSYSSMGKTTYRTASIVTAANRKTQWYMLTKKMGLREGATGVYDIVTPKNQHLFQ